MFCGKCNKEEEEEGEKRKRGRRGEEEKGERVRKRTWSRRRRGGGRREKRGGRPRSLNCFLFLVRGNNQQLGGRLGRANFSDFWYYTVPRVILSKLGGKVLIILFQI